MRRQLIWVDRSRIIQADPHNKMHGRRVEDWQDSEEEAPKRAVRIHTSDQLPRRRKKKNKEKKVERTESDEERLIKRARRAMLETTGNLYGASSSMSRVTRSGSGKGARGLISSSQGMSSQSGSSSASHHQDRLASSQNMPSSSGLQAAAVGSRALNMPSRSGSSIAAAAPGAMSNSAPSQSGSTGDHAALAEGGSVSQANPWNSFQMQYSGRHWGTEKMRAEYWRFCATGVKPK